MSGGRCKVALCLVLVAGLVVPGPILRAGPSLSAHPVPDLVASEMEAGIRDARAVAVDFRNAAREAVDLVAPDLTLQAQALQRLEAFAPVLLYFEPATYLLVPIVLNQLPPGYYGQDPSTGGLYALGQPPRAGTWSLLTDGFFVDAQRDGGNSGPLRFDFTVTSLVEAGKLAGSVAVLLGPAADGVSGHIQVEGVFNAPGEEPRETGLLLDVQGAQAEVTPSTTRVRLDSGEFRYTLSSPRIALSLSALLGTVDAGFPAPVEGAGLADPFAAFSINRLDAVGWGVRLETGVGSWEVHYRVTAAPPWDRLFPSRLGALVRVAYEPVDPAGPRWLLESESEMRQTGACIPFDWEAFGPLPPEIGSLPELSLPAYEGEGLAHLRLARATDTLFHMGFEQSGRPFSFHTVTLQSSFGFGSRRFSGPLRFGVEHGKVQFHVDWRESGGTRLELFFSEPIEPGSAGVRQAPSESYPPVRILSAGGLYLGTIGLMPDGTPAAFFVDGSVEPLY